MSSNSILVFICLLILYVSVSDSSVERLEKDYLNAKPRLNDEAKNLTLKTVKDSKTTSDNASKLSNNSRVDVKSTIVTDVIIGDSNIGFDDSSNHSNDNTNTSYQANAKASDADDTFVRKLPEHVLNLDNGAVRRTFYVVAALTGIVVLYFLVKGVTLRRKSKVTRYGLLAEREIESLDDGDDEDEDTTLFDASRYKVKGRGP